VTSWGGHAKVDRRDPGQPLGLVTLGTQEAEGQADASKLAAPAFSLGAGPAREQVSFQLFWSRAGAPREDSQAGLPRARMGLSVGPVVFQDGDYLGGTANLAARFTDYATGACSRPRQRRQSLERLQGSGSHRVGGRTSCRRPLERRTGLSGVAKPDAEPLLRQVCEELGRVDDLLGHPRARLGDLSIHQRSHQASRSGGGRICLHATHQRRLT
jgi:hypothetical protein